MALKLNPFRMKYREANVWIFARQLDLPLQYAETVTEYLTDTKIPRYHIPEDHRKWSPLSCCILTYLSGYVDSDPYVIERGFLPFRTYEAVKEEESIQYLFYKDSKGG